MTPFNTTMYLYNNEIGATLGQGYFTIRPLPNLLNKLEAKFDSGELWAWTPKDVNFISHTSILRKSNGDNIFSL